MKDFQADLRNDDLFKVLIDIRKKPELYLGEKSLKALDVFIRGWLGGVYTCKDKKKGENILPWLNEFEQYVCNICVHGNGCYGAKNAIFECGYDDVSGFDYYYLLLDDYIKDHAVVNDMDIPEEVLHLKNEIRMVYIDWSDIPDIVGEYVAKNANRLFRLLENERVEKYKSCSMREMSHDGIVFAISDEWNKVSEQMEKFLESCKGKNQGICYKAVKLDEKND